MIGSSKSYPAARPLMLQRHTQIVATGCGVPDAVVTNQQIIAEFNLIASDRAVQYALGISERRRAPLGERVSRYLHAAARMAIERAGIDPERIDPPFAGFLH